ncbi:NAD(P)-binding domain-containing protein, partial [Streptomyces sp. TRM76130]|nr:NAD(P)-binding domain-containing protein [Streptomyces sp. TRM76130]
MTQKVAVLGAGKIGEALLSGMIRAGWTPADLLVTTRRRERADELHSRHGVTPVTNAEAAKTADTLILTVKPQDMGALLDELAPHVPADRLVISGAAGIPTAFFEDRLVAGAPVVRVMTNTPA